MNSSPTTTIDDSEEPFTPLVSRAVDGDSEAWTILVQRLSRLVIKVTHEFDMTKDERNDAFAATFLRIYENLGAVRDPERLPGWVAVVTRNETLALLRARRRYDLLQILTSQKDPYRGISEDRFSDIEDAAEDAQLIIALRAAISRLPVSAQELLRCLVADPPLSYAEISDRLKIPIGAIGPTRQRTLARLRRSAELAPFIRND